ncbi:putative C-S lyase [Marinilabiliaceae bacterium JC017]|nr:putative C-S lyase [Marinilabiliaceae bacterium JC017]
MYDFDTPVNREGTKAYKLELREKYFGSNEVLPLWVADMDFSAPPAVCEAIQARAAHNIYGYTIRTKEFNEAIKNWLMRRHNWSVENSWIEYSPGVVPALTFSIMSFTMPGDGVIIQTPVYPPFYSVVKDNDRKVVKNPLVQENGSYRMNFEELEILTAKPENKVLILCNPHNPLGRVWTKDELETLGDICHRNNVLVLSDEIHSDLMLFGNKHTPFASVNEQMANNSITFMAPSKTFNIAGFNTSYVVASNSRLLNGYRQVLNKLHLNMGHVFSEVILETAYNEGEDWLGELISYLEANARFVVDFINENMPEVKVKLPHATFLTWLDFRSWGWSQKDLVAFLVNKAGVGLNDGVSFGVEGEGFMRMNIASPRSVIKKALEQIFNARKELN